MTGQFETVRSVNLLGPGGPDRLRLGRSSVPSAGPGDLLIDVCVSGVNRADLLQRKGLYDPPPGTTEVLGLEYAGGVAWAGARATEWKVGDRVMGIVSGGGYAERISAPATTVVRAPPGLSPVEAGAIPEVFMTAADALFRQAELQRGESVLVHAAGSGVGTAAIQLAKRAGARVFGTSRSREKLTRARRLGLDEPLDASSAWEEELLDRTEGRGADVILDLVGGAYLRANQRAIANRGRHVVVGVPSGSKTGIDLRMLMAKRAVLRGSVLRTRSLREKARLADYFRREVLPGFADGALVPEVDSVFPPEKAGDAHRRMEANANFGKILLVWREEWPS